MPELSFDVLDARPDVYGTDPTMIFRLRIAETTGDPIHTLVLRAQIQINAQLRSYNETEKGLLADLFGDAARWGDTLRPFNWTHVATMLQGFRGSTEVELNVPCTYDFDVAAAKYLHGLQGGSIPLDFLFSGTVISRGATGYSVTQIPWHKDCAFPLPVATWRNLVDLYWPGGGWIRLRRDTIDELLRFKTAHGLTDWDRTMELLMERVVNSHRFDRAVPIADTILWEGYVLYPYRSSSAKNRLRFNWGVVGPAEEPSLTSTVIVEPGTARLHLRLRFLRLIARDDGWDEAEAVQHDLTVDLDTLGRAPASSPVIVAGSVGTGADGAVRTCTPLEGRLVVAGRRAGDHHLVQVTVENRAPAGGEDRRAALYRSFVGCHVLVASDDDAFVSVLEPPDELAETAAGLVQHRAWPVLVGPEPARDLVLVSPVILYDYPAVATESVGDFYDGTEIDEMLALRVHTLTEEEKAEARRTDIRARAIIDRHDTLDAATMAALHGTIRERSAEPVDPAPEWSEPGPNRVLVGRDWVTPGVKVRLEPARRADVHDMFLRGRTATVAQVVHDVDGEIHVAVTVDDDPAAELFDAQRRYLYFAPDELVPLGGGRG